MTVVSKQRVSSGSMSISLQAKYKFQILDGPKLFSNLLPHASLLLLMAVGRSQNYKHLVLFPSIFTSFLKAQMIYILSQRPFHCFSPSPLTNEWNAPSPRRAGLNSGARKLSQKLKKGLFLHDSSGKKQEGCWVYLYPELLERKNQAAWDKWKNNFQEVKGSASV